MIHHEASSLVVAEKEALPVLARALAAAHRVEAALEEGAVGTDDQEGRALVPKCGNRARGRLLRARQPELRKRPLALDCKGEMRTRARERPTAFLVSGPSIMES